jgi:hypothetical protein
LEGEAEDGLAGEKVDKLLHDNGFRKRDCGQFLNRGPLAQ